MKKDRRLLQVAQLGHPLIRTKAKTVKIKDIHSSEVQQLIDDMIATVMDVDGVGIAAPQVYQPLRIFILASHPNARYPQAPVMEPIAIINPTIISSSQTTITDWEGCLSIPGIRGLVPRSVSVTVSYLTRDGKKATGEFTDFVARIFQHEYDHLEGTVFIDRVESTKDIITEKEYQKIIVNKKK